MKTKIKIRIIFGVIVGIIAILLIIVLRAVIIHINNEMYGSSNVTKELNMDEDYLEIIMTVAKKNADWSKLPLSKNFKKKYKRKDGILKGDVYTWLGGDPYSSNNEKCVVVLDIGHNFKYEDYYIHYTLNDKKELEDVEIVDKIMRIDENGNEVIYKWSMDEKQYIECINQLSVSYNYDEYIFDYINATDKYIEKIGNGFLPYNNCDHIAVRSIDELCSYKEREVYLEAVYTYYDEREYKDWILLDEYTKYFKIHYFTDNNLWIDDVEVEELTKEDIEDLYKEKGLTMEETE